jgi:hypothetical protein
MFPTIVFMTVQREHEAELERLAMRRPLWRERNARASGKRERLVRLPVAYCGPLSWLRGAARPA